jgi:hypothetical protein|tara:strand:- start:15 stop:179 length:165 start_codon:yes stop_codon:yes gene_type:complete
MSSDPTTYPVTFAGSYSYDTRLASALGDPRAKSNTNHAAAAIARGIVLPKSRSR